MDKIDKIDKMNKIDKIDNLQIKILNCGENFENAGMDALLGAADVQHKTKYLQVLARNLDNDFKGYFVVAANGSGEIIAWTYIFTDSRFAFHGIFSGLAEKIYNIFPVKFNTAFISSPVAEYNMIHINGAYKNRENDVIDAMMDAVLRFLKKKGIKLVIIKDHITPYTSERLHKKFIHVHFMPGTFIDLEGVRECEHINRMRGPECRICNDGCSCFDDYLMGLKKKWRANIRNKMNRRKTDLTVEISEAGSLSSEQNSRCHELYCQTREKQRLKHECLSPGYFHECGKEFCGCCKMLIAKTGDTIIGFAQLLESGDDIINVRMGMDYKLNREYNLYYHLLYENIIYCVRNKKKRLYTSQTCYRPKLEAGAKLLPLHTYIYFSNPVFQKIFGRIIASSSQCYSELIAADNPGEVLSKYNLSPY